MNTWLADSESADVDAVVGLGDVAGATANLMAGGGVPEIKRLGAIAGGRSR
jgi:hypothetical protein